MSTTYPYLGTPGSMQQFPGPSGQIARDPINGPSVTPNMAGGESVLHPLKTRDRFTLPYTSRPGTGFADLLMMFRDGVFGRGPFVYVDPAKSNVLGLDVSTMGVVDGAHGWVSTSTAPAVDATTTTPQTGSQVLKWATPGTFGTMLPGTAGAIDMSTAPAYLPLEPTTFSVWAKASTAARSNIALTAYDSTGTGLSTVSGASIGTSFARLSVSAAAGAFPANTAYVAPSIITGATAPANVWIAAAQVEYASAASTWQRGYRSPRVGITGYPGWLSDKFDGYATHTLVLSEAY